jgi:hypothetical protein
MRGEVNSRSVYVIGVGDCPVKIGLADNIASRLSTLQVGCPDELVLHHSVKLPWAIAQDVETAAHRELRDRNRRGEWFDIHFAEAIVVVDRLKEEMLREHQYRVRQDGDLIDRLHTLYELPVDARKRVLQYRDAADANRKIAAHANGYVLEKCGTAAYAAFSLVIAQRKPISGLKPAEARRCDDALAKAIRSLVEFYDLYGEKLADSTMERRRRAIYRDAA